MNMCECTHRCSYSTACHKLGIADNWGTLVSSHFFAAQTYRVESLPAQIRCLQQKCLHVFQLPCLSKKHVVVVTLLEFISFDPVEVAALA